MPQVVVTGLYTLAAVAISLDSGVENGGWSSVLQTLVGTWLSLCLLVLYVSLATSNATGKPWAESQSVSSAPGWSPSR